ncbi:metallophosphoesterase [Bacteroides sp. 519]|uniref:metallophosphoesterase n=1 Tax=Bacteroides sp. 519 TaxID=2302937 RepID=UPI0013D13177|nr:metallophosphoesterase [Bacteroides sp. 519]NDV59225.1 hypothetical protein [Bacteroides sp. 519]
MNRRIFLKQAAKGVILLATAPSLISCLDKKSVKFGIITDLHYSQRASYGTRYFSQTMDKLKAALEVFNKSDLDFLIELGDFKDQDSEPQREATITYLDEIEKVYQTFQGPRYHVLGNHDMDSISKEDFLNHTTNHGSANKKTYYSYTVNGIKFIVLDANFNEDGTPYDSGNFTWTSTYINQEQIEWLSRELADKSKPIVIFVHQLLDSFSDISSSLCVNNAEEIVPLLERNGKVLAVFQGHHHAGHYSCRNNIHYWTMKGMIEGSFPDNNSFAIVEIDSEYNININGFANCEDSIMSSE